MSKTGGTFSIGTIIMIIVAYNFLFDDDDEKEVKIIDQAKEIIVETKEFIIETKDSKAVQEIIQSAKEKFIKDEEEAKEEGEEEIAEVIEEEQSDGPPPKIISAEPEEDQPKTDEFEKL